MGGGGGAVGLVINAKRTHNTRRATAPGNNYVNMAVVE